MTLYIDADACPVRAEAEEVASRLKVAMVVVSNGGIRPSANPLVRMVYVGQGLDVADRWIEEAAGPGDVVVTSDIPLAAAVCAKGARVVKPDGEVLSDRNVAQVLAARNLATEFRSANPLSQGGGARPFSKADRSRFRDRLHAELQSAARAG